MGFGNSNTLRLRRPSFRQNLIDDMIAVKEGRIDSNPQLIDNFKMNSMDVPMITNNGGFVAVVGTTYVGSGDVVGVRRKVEVV